ncbi:MAG: 50S ribosomal protein L24 [Candidatus Kuenenia sp.]|nr:50S ribosomal protein L24 [Candidatus Kuenenia hertensis]
MHIRKNDLVLVIAGNEAGKTGKVMKVLPDKNRVVVKGVKVIYKHVKPSQKNPQGGRIQKETSISASNVLPVCQNKNCEKSGKGVRTKKKILENGGKLRVCVYCGVEISPDE